MHLVSFVELPLAAKLSAFFTPFILWVMLAEFVIDRHGWHVFLPFYKYGLFCPYDLAVLLAAAVPWFLAERKVTKQRQAELRKSAKETGRCC